MPDLLATRVVKELRRTTLAMACIMFFGLPGTVWAQQEVPASLRACAAESDPGQRLDCYDREMKRLLAPSAGPAKSAPPPAAAEATSPAPTTKAASPGPTAKAASPTMQPSSASPGVSSDSAKRTTDTAVARPAAAGPTPSEASAPHPTAAWKKILSGGPSSHVAAHIASLERSPGAMVIHLDNGQVWRQVGRASGDLTLRAGDKVTIEKHLGSYWLTARYVSGMQVRQQPQ